MELHWCVTGDHRYEYLYWEVAQHWQFVWTYGVLSVALKLLVVIKCSVEGKRVLEDQVNMSGLLYLWREKVDLIFSCPLSFVSLCCWFERVSLLKMVNSEDYE